MKLHLLLFAGLAERLGGSVLDFEIDAPAVTAGLIKDTLARRFPDAAAAITQAYTAVNQAYAADDALVAEGDEIALIPPVSGGEPELAELTHSPLRPEEVAAKVHHPDHGATLSFTGTTRGLTGSLQTVRLEYEAYEPMALRTMGQVIGEVADRWPGALCAITHRLGAVGVGEASVVIAVSAPHRDAAYEASRYAIDRLKQIVPIWKKEWWDDGSEWKGHQLGPWDPTAELHPEHRRTQS